MFLILFSITLLLLNIYSFIKKKYLYLFIPCFLFLPEYYGFEFSESLPLLSVRRIMIIVFFFYVFLNKKQEIKKYIHSYCTKEYMFLFGYAMLRIIANLYYITRYGAAAKAILEIIIEQILLLFALFALSPSKEEMIKLMKAIVWSAFFLFIIGIIETLTFIRPFDQLYTVHRYMLNEHYIRLGLLRSVATMGMPGLYSNMCLLIIPLILYLYNITSKKRYLILCFADIFAAIHSGSRSFFFYLAFVMIFYFICILRNKSERFRCIKNTVVVLIAILVTTSILSICNERYKYFYNGNIKAVLNELGMNYDLNADSPEGVNGYGGNYNPEDKNQGGIGSRRAQLSGIVYSLRINPMFGLGIGALERDEVRYYYYGHWDVRKAIDVGIVEIVVYEGLLGMLGFAMLFLFLFESLIRNKLSKCQTLSLMLLILCYIITTLSSANMMNFLILTVFLVKMATTFSYKK